MGTEQRTREVAALTWAAEVGRVLSISEGERRLNSFQEGQADEDREQNLHLGFSPPIIFFLSPLALWLLVATRCCALASGPLLRNLPALPLVACW